MTALTRLKVAEDEGPKAACSTIRVGKRELMEGGLWL